MRRIAFHIAVCLLGLVVLSPAGCSGREAGQQEVVIYTSLDKVFSEPILEAFEKETGIRVLPVYDSEATKTTGLVNRLITEKGNPKADVFWTHFCHEEIA
jgi:iron(III) transport system substrate-binding protein